MLLGVPAEVGLVQAVDGDEEHVVDALAMVFAMLAVSVMVGGERADRRDRGEPGRRDGGEFGTRFHRRLLIAGGRGPT